MNSDPRDYKVELSSVPASNQPAVKSSQGSQSRASSPKSGNPFLSVHFACCNVYQRIYKSPDGTAYRGRCPRCGKTVNFPIGQGGTNERSFVVE
jgi:hypothetical protein